MRQYIQGLLLIVCATQAAAQERVMNSTKPFYSYVASCKKSVLEMVGLLQKFAPQALEEIKALQEYARFMEALVGSDALKSERGDLTEKAVLMQQQTTIPEDVAAGIDLLREIMKIFASSDQAEGMTAPWEKMIFVRTFSLMQLNNGLMIKVIDLIGQDQA